MKKKSFLLLIASSLLFFYSCDNSDSEIESDSSTQGVTRTHKPDPNFVDEGGEMPDGEGGGERGTYTFSYTFPEGNFSYQMQKGAAIFTLSYDKSKKPYPLTSFIKFETPPMTKFDLERCSACGFKYDTNNDLQYFEVIVRYDIYKMEQVPGNSTNYAWFKMDTRTYLLKYTRYVPNRFR